MPNFSIQTAAKRQVIDITEQINKFAKSAPVNGQSVLNVFVQHTTAALAVMDLDPGTDQDFIDFLDHLVPQINWHHPHDPNHAPDHLLASLLGPSLTIPYADGELRLGIWQHVVLVEFDGPRQRQIVVTV